MAKQKTGTTAAEVLARNTAERAARAAAHDAHQKRAAADQKSGAGPSRRFMGKR